MIESCVLGPKTGPERWAGYQTNIPPTMVSVVVVYPLLSLRRHRGIHDSQMGFWKVGLVMVLVSGRDEVYLIWRST